MRKKFAAYYPTTKDTHSLIWKDCDFVFDANVLLDLYRYSPSTSKELLTILDGIESRLWLPHQVSLEFFRNRPEVIIDQENMFLTATKVLDAITESARQEITKHLSFRDHPSIDKKQFLSDITTHVDKLKQQLEIKRKAHAQLLLDDPTLQHILSLFENKVGDPLSEEELQKVYSEGKSGTHKKYPQGTRMRPAQTKRMAPTSTAI